MYKCIVDGFETVCNKVDIINTFVEMEPIIVCDKV